MPGQVLRKPDARPIWTRLSVQQWMVVCFVMGLIWRMFRWLVNGPLWGDEAFIAVNFLTHDFSGMLDPLDHSQVVPLGYLWVQFVLSKAFGTSEIALRLTAVLSGLGVLILMWRWLPRVLNKYHALAVFAIFSGSYYPVRHAAEVKPYGSDLFVSLLLLIAGWAVWSKPKHRGRWAILCLGLPLAVWFSYPSVFVGVSILLMLLWRTLRDRELRKCATPWIGGFATAAFFVISGFLMWQIFARNQAAGNVSLATSDHWKGAIPPGFTEGGVRGVFSWLLAFVRWGVEVHTGNMLAYPAGGKNFGSTGTFLLLIVGIATLWRRRRALLGFLIMLAGLCLIAAIARLYPYGGSARTSLFLAPTICILAGVGVVTLLSCVGRLSLRWLRESRLGLMCGWQRGPRSVISNLCLFALAMVLLTVAGTAREFLKPYKTIEDIRCRQTVLDLSNQVVSGDRWIFVGDIHDVVSGDDEQAHAPILRVPNIARWGGDAARARFYLILASQRKSVPLDFGPDPVNAIKGAGRTWVFHFETG